MRSCRNARRLALLGGICLALALPAATGRAATPEAEPPDDAPADEDRDDDGTVPGTQAPNGDDAAVTAAPATPSAGTPPRPHKVPRKAHKAPRRPGGPLVQARLSRAWRFRMPLRFGLAGGWQQGAGSLRVEGATADLDVGATPELRFHGDRFRVALDGRYRRRDTLGFTLPQRTLEGSLRVSGKPHDAVELWAEGRAARVERPGWPDLYQPVLDDDGMPAGGLLPTDRHSRRDLEAAAGVRWEATKALALRGRITYRDRACTKDPAYDGLLNPTHLTPADQARWRGEVGAEGHVDRWDGLLLVRLDAVDYRYNFARDAATGLTHAPPGGTPANPLQRYLRFAALHRSDLDLPELKSRLSLSAGYEHNHDRFRGYYDWNDALAGASLRVRPVGGLRLEAAWDGRFRWYGANAYRAGGTHPPLDGGDSRRTDRWNRLRLRASWAFRGGRVEPFVEADFRWHDTNFPDYVPGLNPPGLPYDIDFDYADRAVRVGFDTRF